MDFKDYDFFHVIDLPDGRVTPGVTDHRDQPKLLGIDASGLLQGRRVLDVGANDGFWCGPSEACVVAWMRSAGFSTIFRESVSRKRRVTRGNGSSALSVTTGDRCSNRIRTSSSLTTRTSLACAGRS